MADNIVTDWLRSLNLVHYTQAFLDNGYDDLEICKQIGSPDLDAIGVLGEDHRQRILGAVKTLREQGGTAVYFTLENPDTDGGGRQHRAHEELGPRLDDYKEGKTGLLAYPKLQLKHIIRDKLVRDDVDLSGPPYISSADQSGCRSSFMALAMKYASELKTHVEDVLDRLEELRWWKITKDVDTLSSKSLSPVRSIHSPTLYGYMPRGTPPPLPSCPPPTTSHSDRCAELEKHMKGVHLRLDTQGVSTNYTGNYIALDGDKEAEGKKKSSGLGKLFRNMGLRRSGRKYAYKQHHGDPNAYDITMSDDDRIALMVMVKEGKITTEHALEVGSKTPGDSSVKVKRFEEDRLSQGDRKDADTYFNDQFCGCRESPLMGRQGLHIRGRRQMRHDLTKPAKSQSDIYSGASPRCELCRSRSQDVEERIRWPDDRLIGDFQCSQHRRVHSIGHMEFYQSQSPEFMRSTSCSPTRGSHAENVKSPSPRCRIYSPVLYLTQGNKPVDEELLISLSPEDGKEEGAKKNETVLNKSSSGTSVESDASVECLRHGPLASEIVATRNGDLTNCSNSTVSASSETSPAIGRKPGTLPTKMRNFVLQRSNSYSTGDDGMSSDYDEQDELTMKLSQSCPRGMLARANISDKGKDLKNDLKKRILRPKEPYYKQKQVEREFRDGGPDINQGIPADFVHHSYLCLSRALCKMARSEQNPASGFWIDNEVPVTAASFHASHHHQYLTSPGLTGTKTADGIPIYSGPFLGQARALFNYIPEPHKKDALTLKKGDIIHVINMVQPGLWKGLHNKKLGTFKFCHVEMITDDTPRCQRKDRIHRRRNSQRSKPRNVEELMQRIGLEHLTSIFLLNGYDKLETFVDIDEDDLNELNIRDPEQRAKLLTAAELLVDCNSPDILECAPRSDELGATPSDTPASLSPPTIFNTDPPPPMPIQPICRDSGFYASSENSIHKGIHLAKSFDEETQKKRSGQSGPDVGHTRNLKTKACQTNHTVTADSSLLTDDKELSAEDREVSEITDGFMQKDSHKLSPKIVSTLDTAQRCSSAQQASRDNVANGFISHSSSFSSMSSGCTHLSPTFHHRAKKEDQPEGDGKVTLHSSGSEGSDETHSDVSDISPHKKPKPFSQRKPGTKLSSVKINGIPAQSDRGISPSYYILSSPSLSKRDACTQFNPRSKSTFAMETQSQKTLPNNKLSETENSAHHNLSGTLGRPSGFPSEHRDSPSRSLPRPPKPPSRSLIPLLKAKLSDENIDLTQEPYSDKVGHCGVPPLLVQRYAEELRNDVWGIAAVLEQVRTTQLQLQGREGVTSESLGKACLTSCDLKISSLKDFLTSIGLPMYKEILVRSGYSSMERVLGMTDSDVSKIMRDARHTKRMLHALEWVRARLASPTRKSRMATVKDQV